MLMYFNFRFDSFISIEPFTNTLIHYPHFAFQVMLGRLVGVCAGKQEIYQNILHYS